jgi:alginate O-acetyltransferase complex protein AlgI
MGLFKKLVIADHMALFADPVFANPQQYGTGAIWLATIAYSLQIYGDFSGYSDMALGAAHMLGYKLAVNFNMPYLAPNIADFWRRWHISLSSWLRDYLFIPLGGSRGGQWLIFRNLLITMTLGGLWHGASWTFVLWGVLHGILLIGHRLFRQFCDPRPALGQMLQSSAGTALRIALTFLSVAFGWILFRATSFDAAWAVLSRLGWGHEGLDAPLNTNTFWWVVAAVIACHFAASRDWWRRIYRRAPAPLTGFAYALTLNVVFLLAPGASKMFIYFQF